MSKAIPLIAGHYYRLYNRGNNGENLIIEARNLCRNDFFQKPGQVYTHYLCSTTNKFLPRRF